ncbi:hypothetical protein N9E57_00760 [Gammaproteobacteria bacterium]|nr:hypothetical protein [Gammaproteobacteria bacterium]
MYKLLKIGAFIMAGRFLKPRLKGLIALIAFWLVLRFLHAEYLSYVELSNDTQYLVTAALTKIILYVFAFLIYVFITERKILLRSQREIESRHRQEFSSTEDDGFDFIRQKKKLDSSAEKLLGKD